MSDINNRNLRRTSGILLPVRVLENKKLNKSNSWLKLELLRDFKNPPLPGQFVMVWVPGVKEIPMSIAYFRNKTLGILVKKVGEATSRLYYIATGDFLGIKGPLGNNIPLEYDRYILVAGGTGIAPFLYLLEYFRNSRKKLIVLYGAKNLDELVLKGYIESISTELYIATDDGSLGFKGTAVELFESLLKERQLLIDSNTLVAGCGPEPMLKALAFLSEQYSINTILGLERRMKCGIGACGSCELGSTGYLVCRDGPWFDYRIPLYSIWVNSSGR